MAGVSQKVIFRGLSKAELAQLQNIFGIEPNIVNVVMKEDELSIVEHPPEHTYGEPLTWAAIWLFTRNTKIGARATVLLDRILKSRQSIVVRRNITIRRANGDVETIDASIEARGDAAEGLLKKLGRDALALDTKHTASPTTIDLVPDAGPSKTLSVVGPKASPDPAEKAKRVQAAKKSLAKLAKAAATTQRKSAVPKNRKMSAAMPKGK